MFCLKIRPLALAILLLLFSGSHALAQPRNRPANPANADQQKAVETAFTFFVVWVGFIICLGVVGLVVQIIMLVFVYNDAKARNTDPMIWLLIVFFTGLIGLIVWLCVRPPLGGNRRRSRRTDW